MKVKQYQINFLTYNNNQTKNLFSATNSWHDEDTNVHKQNYVLSPQIAPPLQEVNFLPGCRAKICTGVNASMTRVTMIHATEEGAKSLIRSNPVIFIHVIFFLLTSYTHGFGKIQTK